MAYGGRNTYPWKSADGPELFGKLVGMSSQWHTAQSEINGDRDNALDQYQGR